MLSTKIFPSFRVLLPKSTPTTTASSPKSKPSHPTTIPSLTKTLTLRTCTAIYEQLREKSPHLYKHSPLNGFDVTVEYADSAVNEQQQFDCTILAIHGGYGYMTHYSGLFKHFAGTRTRVVAPNLPDFTYTRKYGYWHSAIEKSTFLKDFLVALGIDQVDCLVAHSLGVHAVGGLFGPSSGPARIKSVALLSPQTLWIKYNHKTAQMPNALLFRNAAWYWFLDRLKIHQSSYWSLGYPNIDSFLTVAAIIADQDGPRELYRQVDHLTNSTTIPLSILTGSADSIISPESIAELHKKLGIEEVMRIDPKSQEPDVAIKQNGKRMNSYEIVDGGHVCHIKYSKLTNLMIENLLYSCRS